MNEAFVVCNQLQQFWGKKKTWVDGTDPKKILCCKHEDEGFNLLVELSSKDIDLRGQVTAVSIDEKRVPQVEPSEHLIVEIKETAAPMEAAENVESTTDATPVEADQDAESTTDATPVEASTISQI